MAFRFRQFGWVVLFLLIGPVRCGAAATHQPWNRRPGVLLYHLKENASIDQRAAAGRLLAGSHPLASRAVQTAKSYRAAEVAVAGSEEEMADALVASGA